MAEGTITVQIIARTGIVPSYAAATADDGDKFANDGKTYLHVKNDDSGAHLVTVDSQALCTRGSDHDEPNAVSVAAGAEALFGPFPTSRFNDAEGYAHVSYDGETDVTHAAIRLPSG